MGIGLDKTAEESAKAMRTVHAVVVGASVSGLLAAKALAASYHTVTVVERDDLLNVAGVRRGVPHGEHLHVLMP
jgi:2-polyprenyl-6-methoxyphenol hydroxylase-like FAD-dependent oxidoreductase